jgi:ADP-heptose:LPS heptosyltransferase
MKKKILGERYESVDLRVRLILFLIDIIGTLLFLPLRIVKDRTEEYRPRNVRNILILRLDGVGDLVISTAALREIRHGFPNANITLVVGPWAKDIAKCITHYDRLVIHDSFLFSFFRGNRKIDLVRELGFIRRLRSSKFDLGIDLRGDLLSIIPLFLSGAKWRFAKDTRGGGFLLTNVARRKNPGITHEKDKALDVVESLCIRIRNRDMELSIPDEDLKFVESYLKDKGINSLDLIVTVAPCALYRWRSWREERFAKVASIIGDKFRGKVILMGSERDRGVLERIRGLARPKPLNSEGDLTLSQVAGLIGRSAVFIGNDSGLIHIAAAMKTPIVQLFGPGEPEKFGYVDNSSILLVNGDCRYRPCTQQKCRCPDDWCMDKISVEDVMRALSAIVGSPWNASEKGIKG